MADLFRRRGREGVPGAAAHARRLAGVVVALFLGAVASLADGGEAVAPPADGVARYRDRPMAELLRQALPAGSKEIDTDAAEALYVRLRGFYGTETLDPAAEAECAAFFYMEGLADLVGEYGRRFDAQMDLPHGTLDPAVEARLIESNVYLMEIGNIPAVIRQDPERWGRDAVALHRELRREYLEQQEMERRYAPVEAWKKRSREIYANLLPLTGRLADPDYLLAEIEHTKERRDAIDVMEQYLGLLGPKDAEPAESPTDRQTGLARQLGLLSRELLDEYREHHAYYPQTRLDDMRRLQEIGRAAAARLPPPADAAATDPAARVVGRAAALRPLDEEEKAAPRALMEFIEDLYGKEEYARIARECVWDLRQGSMGPKTVAEIALQLERHPQLFRELFDAVAGRREAAWLGIANPKLARHLFCVPKAPPQPIQYIMFYHHPRRDCLLLLIMDSGSPDAMAAFLEDQAAQLRP